MTALRLPPGFQWQRVWEALVESCQFCADVAAQHGKTVIMEPRIGEGLIDWPEFLRTPHQMGYNGYLGLDLGLAGRLVEGYRRSVERLLAIAKELNIDLEV